MRMSQRDKFSERKNAGNICKLLEKISPFTLI